jgi:DNA-binding MarR family transcriptional regulator
VFRSGDPRRREASIAIQRRSPAAGPGALTLAVAQVAMRGSRARMHGIEHGTLPLARMAETIAVENPRELSNRIAMGRAIWREFVVGFASQLADLRLGFTQLAALYALAESATTTIGDLADMIGRSPSATSRLVGGLVRRGLIARREDAEDRRVRSLELSGDGRAMLALVDRARADQFIGVVRLLPPPERTLVAMAVTALANRAISRRGKLRRVPDEPLF